MEAVTFLGNQDNTRALYAIPGLDYVAHEDIIPYTSTESTPIQHQLFSKFLTYEPDKEPPFAPRETLLAWQEKNHPWLELSDVHRETTENIRVTVIPFYMGCRLSQNNNVYWVRIAHLYAEGTKIQTISIEFWNNKFHCYHILVALLCSN